MKALIVCNGEIKNYCFYKKYFDSSKLIICVDGAAYHLKKFGIRPHVLIGDFDSITCEQYNYFKNQGVEIKKFPIEKDEIDTELAVEYAIDAGCNEIILIGAIGSRFDHTLANIFLLKKMVDKGVRGWIINENNQITLIKDNIILEKENNEKISLIPFSEKVEGVTTKRLYYPLDNATLETGPTRGISNEFTDDTAEVSIKRGLLLVIKARD
jgi:thiamine pyrophosphokinase